MAPKASYHDLEPRERPRAPRSTGSDPDVRTADDHMDGHGEQPGPTPEGGGPEPPQVSSLASPHRPKASDGSLEPPRREYL